MEMFLLKLLTKMRPEKRHISYIESLSWWFTIKHIWLTCSWYQFGSKRIVNKLGYNLYSYINTCNFNIPFNSAGPPCKLKLIFHSERQRPLLTKTTIMVINIMLKEKPMWSYDKIQCMHTYIHNVHAVYL